MSRSAKTSKGGVIDQIEDNSKDVALIADDEDDQNNDDQVVTPPPKSKEKKFRFSPKGKKRASDFSCTVTPFPQCLGDRKTCMKDTVFDIPYCKEHLQKMLHLQIRSSGFLVKTKGVFAYFTSAEKKKSQDNIVFKKNQRIVQYTGTKLDREELAMRYATKEHLAPYVIEIDKDYYLDAACVRTVGAHIAVTDERKEANVDIVRVQGGGNVVFVRAIKDIKAGEELIRYSRIAYNAKYIEVHYSPRT